ncbi:hypothetical protein QBC45DRAFT_229185 [Copromyces sp. CBS 386.78]|nr:hypothetical protein QBC45DRAFT_229185 [Copromyces sp. CBS 386.78]
MRSASDLVEKNPLATAMKHRWFLLAEDYSVRQLTQETDKLPALSGVAQSYQQYFGPEEAVYVAGTWSTHLPDALLWAIRQPSDDSFAVRASTYIAPSWSWTSVRTPISYSSLRLKEAPIDDVIDTSSITPKSCHPADDVLAGLKVKEMKGTPKYGPDPYGALLPNGSYLLLTGARLVPIELFRPTAHALR